MRKFMTFLLVGIMIFALAACGNTETQTENVIESQNASYADTTESVTQEKK